MCNRMLKFMEKFKTLSAFQFGFRKRHSAEAALAFLIDNITKALYKGDYFVGLFIDLPKAFDTVEHSILLQKLNRYGFRGVVLEWLHNYLNNRQQ